jgi:hypothetical protein
MNPMASMGRPTGGMPSLGAAPMSQAPTPQMGGMAPSTGNVMQITSTLRGMSDQQLQQYASMHKSDPFVFPLAFQESQTRKQMRAGQAAQMAGQKPPPVVDQDLQQMSPPPQALPEDQGIGAIPAQNLQNMADGGIAGYADGGQQPGMFNYAQMAPAVDLHPNSGVTPRSMAGGGLAHFKQGGYEPISAEQLKSVEYTAPDAAKMQESILGMAQPMTKESAEVYKPFADYFKQQQTELSGRKDKNIDNALLTAGLSMMGGTSQHALQNISKGGLEGLNAYNTAQKADEEAKRALMQSQLMLAQAQQADKIGNRNYAAGLYEKAESFKSHAAQSKAKALEIMSTDKYHMGALQNAELVARNNAAYQQGMLGYHQTMADIAKETKPTGEDLTNIRLNRLLESDPGYKALLAERALAAKDRDEDGYQLADKKLQNFLAAKRQELGLKPGVIPEAIQPKPTDTQESHWYDIFNPNTKARLKPSTNMGDLLSREDMPGMPRTTPSNMPNVVDFSKLPK